MVIVKDIELQLVSSDTKTPFKEHEKESNTFVEVEPDAEYYLSFRRVAKAFKGNLYLDFRIDGKKLPGFLSLSQDIDIGPIFVGLYSRSNGVEFDDALRFVVPHIDYDDVRGNSARTGMGKIEVDVFERIGDGYKEEPSKEPSMKPFNDPQFSSPPEKITVETGAFATAKKCIRSMKGNHRETFDDWCTIDWEPGEHLYTITLYYCATPGLIAVGVLPKPPLWENHRLNFPERLMDEEKKELEKIVVVSVKRNRKGNEIIELGDSGDEGSEVDTNKSKKSRGDGDGNQILTLPTNLH